jgi:hypothetical protein
MKNLIIQISHCKFYWYLYFHFLIFYSYWIYLLIDLIMMKFTLTFGFMKSGSSSITIQNCMLRRTSRPLVKLSKPYFTLREKNSRLYLLQQTFSSKSIATAQLKAVQNMVNDIPESKRRIVDLKLRISKNLSKGVINFDSLRRMVVDMELESSQDGFWDNQDAAQSKLAELARIKTLISRVEKWKTQCDDVETLLELASSDSDDAGKFIA